MKKTYLVLLLLFSGTSAFAQASLPFSYDGGKNALPTGLTQSGLGTDYASPPHLKHDNTGDYLVLHYNGIADSLRFAIRYYGGSNDTLNGNFLLQLSDDGITYTTIQLYGDTTGGIVLTNASTRYDTITGIPASTQYVRWIYNNKINGNIGIGAINLSGSSPTPLRLISFSGKASATGNQLSWQIADAKNISGFVVQQAVDGKTFRDIGFAGYHDGQKKFQFTDTENHHPNDFYRLKIMDINNQLSYSPVVSVNSNSPIVAVSYTPNPVRSTLYLKGEEDNITAKIYLTNLSGKILLQQQVFIRGGTVVPINITNLPSGVYFLNIQNSNGSQQFKIIKE